MKKNYSWRTAKSAILLLTILLFSNWSISQVTQLPASNISTVNPNVTDPSENNPNYEREKFNRITEIRSTDRNTSISLEQNLNLNGPGANASLNKATSACFIPIDASYTALPRNDDGSFGPIALPFTFDLYGASYTQVWINTNGNLTFTGAYSPYSASGFPFTQPMVAPFWGDVDTRNLAGGQIHYKLSATNLIVTWDNVGYFSQAVDKLNEFQVVISDGVDPITGLGQNVCFNYGDMQWTTGSASGGTNGFGGTPATVGVNKGNNIDFYQLGRFGVNSAVYDGPGGNTDGINYLDQNCYCSQVSSAVNIAPIANNFPSGVINIDCGETYNLDFSFIPPEVNQTVSTTINVNGACGTTFSSTSGSLSNINFSLLGQQCNEGTNVITFTATDNGTPVETTTVTLTVIVGTCCDLTATSTGQDESCANQSDGSISISTTGGTAPLSYSINGGASYSGSPNFTGLATGTYVVLSKDANGCESIAQTITISGPAQLGSASSATSILCNGGTSTVTVSGSGGTPPYSGTGNFTVSAGPYSFTVTDANGCTSVTTGSVNEPTQLIASATATEILCNGETTDITVTATGGTAPYTGTGVYTESAGTYTYVVSDANGCTESITITVTEPTQLMASATATEILCNGETTDITVTATGGTAPYTGNIVYTESAGTYTYTVTDSKGCSVDVTITVTEPTQLMASATATEILCNGETTDITVTATGGTAPYTGDIVYTESAGTYTYTVTDSKGCSVDVTITVTEPTQLMASATATEILCNGETTDITVTATGGTAPYTGTGVYAESAGTYTYTVTDSKGCSVDVTITVTEPTQLAASATATEILCNGETTDITVTATGGTAPYTGNIVYTESAGTYTYTVTDSKGCSVDVTITVTEPTQLMASATATEILCNGETTDITVTATGGTAPYTGDIVYTESAGTYTYTVTDSKGCSVDVTITVTEPTQLMASATATEILCNGETTDITVVGSGGTAPYTGTGVYTESAGTYTYTVTDSKGCSVDVTITVTEPTQLAASATATEILCNGETTDITVTATGGTAPYTGDIVYTESAGTYTYTVTDSKGCSVDVTITVTEPTALIAYASCPVIDCFGGTADIAVFASGGTPQYTGEGVFNVPAGTYTYTITDANGCTSDVTHTVDQPDEIEANITPQNHVIDCIPIPVTLTANPTGGTGGPYTYLWSTGETTPSIEVNPNTTSTYTVEITDANGCTANAATNGTTVSVLNRCGNNNQKVVICHVPSGNNQNPQTICISPNALNPHLSNLWNLHGGDYCGPCQSSSSLATDNTNVGDNLFIRAGINMNNESIELSYRIGYDSKVRLEIYDMAGTLVDVVHTAQANEGELYEFKVNTNKIISGVYIYQFITDNETHIDKLQIIQ